MVGWRWRGRVGGGGGGGGAAGKVRVGSLVLGECRACAEARWSGVGDAAGGRLRLEGRGLRCRGWLRGPSFSFV
jgi:hypothetical protein